MNIFQDGVRLFKEGKYNEAVEKLHTVASAEHKNHKAWNALGVALSKTGDFNQSIICFENALSLDPGNCTYEKNLERARIKGSMQNLKIPDLKNKGSTEFLAMSKSSQDEISITSTLSTQHSGNKTKALSALTESSDNPEKYFLAENLLKQALSLFGQGTYHDIPGLIKESLDYTNQALEVNPDYYDAWQLKVSILTATAKNDPQDYTQALLACDKALSLKPDQASMWFNKAGILESLGRYEEAITSYDNAYSFSSDEPMRLGLILMKKGTALEMIGHEKEALLTFEEVQITDRFFGDAMEKRSGILEKEGNHELAISSLRTAGLSFQKTNQFEKAIDTFNRILRSSPEDEEVIYHKGISLLALFEQTQIKSYLEEALLSFDSALHLHPDNMTYLIQKGRCLLDLGRYEEGLQSLDRALWINPGDGITLMNKGIALFQLSRHDEALKYFDLVSSQHPQHAAPWMMKARIHLDWKQYDSALSDIEKAAERSPDDSRILELKAVILRALGMEEEALAAEEKAGEI